MATMRTSLDNWAALAAVVDKGGFRQAAGYLHRSQSAISYSVSRLQEQLGVALLEPQGRKAVLTANGRHLLQRARALLADLVLLEDLAQSLKQAWEPELKLVVDAAFPRDRLLRVLAQLQQRCGSTQIQLADAVLSGAEEAITSRSADVVVTTRIPADFLGESLLDVEFVAVALPSHPLFTQPQPLTATVLARYTQAVVRDSGGHSPRSEGWLGAHQRCTVSSIEASLALVRAGLAYGWLPVHVVAESLREGALLPLPIAVGGRRKLPLSLVLVGPERAGPAAQVAVECFRAASSGWPDAAANA
jgi:DNA-binding transcriptional LysR family regulator